MRLCVVVELLPCTRRPLHVCAVSLQAISTNTHYTVKTHSIKHINKNQHDQILYPSGGPSLANAAALALSTEPGLGYGLL